MTDNTSAESIRWIDPPAESIRWIDPPAESIRWIDNHSPLPDGADGDEQVARAVAAGVTHMIDVGTDLSASRRAIATAARHPGRVHATVGLHPHDATAGTDGLVELLGSPGVVAVGECGLDYHYDHSPRDIQQRVFAEHIAWAHQVDLPLVIHTRSAWDDTFAILDAEGMPRRTVFHCFTGGPAEAEGALDRGAVLSFSGIVTFPSADDLRAALRVCPLESILVETDSPYLAPVPLRGRPNEPANVGLVGSAMAIELQVDLPALAAQVWRTTVEFYGLDAP